MPEQQLPEEPSRADQRRAAELAVALTAATAAAAAPGVLAVLLPLGIPRSIGLLVLAVVYRLQPDNVAGFGAAGRVAQRQAVLRRGAYVLAAARRVNQARLDAARDGVSQRDAVRSAVEREHRYQQQQRDAETNRMRAAASTDLTALTHGPLLGWYAIRDARTSAECRAADGGTFLAGQPPVIGYPGAVHPHCRCRPGPPRRGARSVDEKLAAAGFTAARTTAA